MISQRNGSNGREQNGTKAYAVPIKNNDLENMHCVRDAGVAGSNPATPTKISLGFLPLFPGAFKINRGFGRRPRSGRKTRRRRPRCIDAVGGETGLDAVSQARLSCPAKAGHPVRCGLSFCHQQPIPSLRAQAKQSIAPSKERMDCFVVSLLAMTARYDSAFSRRDAPELCRKFAALETEGVGNAGCPMHPQPRVV